MTGEVLTNNLYDLSVSVTVAEGGCYHCGNPTRFPDHNSCEECFSKMMTDLAAEDSEVFDC